MRRPHRHLAWPHAGFVASLVVLPRVAEFTSGDDVSPLGASTRTARNDVVVTELARRLSLAAVLASVTVTLVDVPPAELHAAAVRLRELSQANDGRHLPRDGR